MHNAQLFENVKGLHLGNLRALSSALTAKDFYTIGHTARVAAYAVLLAAELGWTPRAIQQLEEATYLHDIGKIAVADRVLLKSGAADRRGVGADEAAPDHQRRDHRGPAGRRLRGRRAPPPRALGRRRLPGRPGRRGHPARRPAPLPRGLLRRHVVAPRVPAGADATRSASRSCAAAAARSSTPAWWRRSCACSATWRAAGGAAGRGRRGRGRASTRPTTASCAGRRTRRARSTRASCASCARRGSRTPRCRPWSPRRPSDELRCMIVVDSTTTTRPRCRTGEVVFCDDLELETFAGRRAPRRTSSSSTAGAPGSRRRRRSAPRTARRRRWSPQPVARGRPAGRRARQRRQRHVLGDHAHGGRAADARGDRVDDRRAHGPVQPPPVPRAAARHGGRRARPTARSRCSSATSTASSSSTTATGISWATTCCGG